jgi:hypothetical protein
MNFLLQAGAIALAALVSAPAANATCTQADAMGTWASYMVGLDVKTDYWVHCTLKIDATGKFTAKTSSCTADSGLISPAEGTFHLINGTVCAFKGGIQLTKGTAENFINHATLGFDKHTAEGVGTFEGGGFSFNLVRIK